MQKNSTIEVCYAPKINIVTSSRVRLIRVRLVLVNLNPINDTYMRCRVPRASIEAERNIFLGPPGLACPLRAHVLD